MAFRVHTLHPDDPPDAFPDPANVGVAIGQPDGLVAIGGDLSPQRLVAAYQRGIFPWFDDDQPILWWCPEPRAIIRPADFHMSRSLARELKRGGWQISVNTCFEAVINGCASNRGRFGTWITPEMTAAYVRLHELGYAHSVESWHNGELAGGIYGIRLGNKFFGESMYTRITNGSKVAISGLIAACRDENIDMLDCQMSSEHLETLGMQEISRTEFLRELDGLDSAPGPLGQPVCEPQAAEFLAVLAS